MKASPWIVAWFWFVMAALVWIFLLDTIWPASWFPLNLWPIADFILS